MNNSPFKKIKKRRNWTDIEIKADDIKKLPLSFLDFLNEERPTVRGEFENGSISSGDIFEIRETSVYFSDQHSGIVEWSEDENEYIRHYFGMTQNLGKLISITIEWSRELEKALK